MYFSMAIMFFLYILASLYILQYTINSYLSSNSDFVLINAKKTDTIEHTVRHALKKYPTREIYIVNKSHDSEMVKILKHFENDYERIHIIDFYKYTDE